MQQENAPFPANGQSWPVPDPSPRLARPPSPLKTRLSRTALHELCRAAKRVWNKLPEDDNTSRHLIFEWRGDHYITRMSLFGVHVYDAEDRKIAAMIW
jgi:hypothetical protein